MSPPTNTRSVRRRFLVLLGLRWLPVGLMVPVLVLLLLERGLTLGQLGIAFAAQGLMVLLLELPTGGLADTIGRKKVLIGAGLFELAAITLLIFVATLPLFALAFALQGIYRALESGPLDSWYVDVSQSLDPGADIEQGLSQGGMILGIAIGVGSLASSALVAFDPIPAVDPLVTPLIVTLLLRVVGLVAIAVLMSETAPPAKWSGTRRLMSEVKSVVVKAVTTIRVSTVLIALVAVEFIWGFGQTAFETFTPAKLDEVVGNADQAAAILGPLSAGAWMAAAGGAALVPWMTRRWGPSVSGAALRVAQGIAVLGIGLATGVIGVVIAYVLVMTVHGASNPVHQGMLHRAVKDPGTRATVVSANSMTAQTGGMLGGIALGVLADATSLTLAIVFGAVILASAAPLYLIAGRSVELQVST